MVAIPIAEALAYAFPDGTTQSLSGNSFNISAIGTGTSAGNATSSAAAAALKLRNHDSNGPKLTIFSWVMTAIVIVVVGMRFWSKGVILKMVMIEDWLILPATALAIVMAVITQINVDKGMGMHIYNVKKTNMVTLLKFTFAGNVTYLLTLATIKISMVFQLHRISAPDSKTRKVIIGVFVFAIIVSFVNILLSIFRCLPVAYHWTRVIPGAKGSCLDFTIIVFTTSGLNIAMDLLIWITPMPLLFKLKLPIAQKIGLILIMSLGGIVCAAAIARTEASHRLNKSKIASSDNTYYQVEALLWSIAEANLAIICASLPTIRPLLRAVMPGVFGTQMGSGGYADGVSGRSRTGLKGSRGGSIPLESKVTLKDDDGDSVEELTGKYAGAGVMRKVEVEVAYHERDTRSEKNIGLPREM